MDSLDIKNMKKIHFIGIGGVSMSSLAEIMADNGYTVTGSDSGRGDAVLRLQSKGIKIFAGQSADNIGDYDLVVYTAAIHNGNPELARARALGITCVERAVFLGELLGEYKTRIGVCGTHGKTTTTSMLALIFLDARKSPTILIGGTLPEIGANFVSGGKDYAIFESCEYVDSFLHFPTDLPVVLNVEADHLDYFKNLDAIKASFLRYVSQAKTAVFNIDNDGAKAVSDMYQGVSVTVSLGDKNADYSSDYTPSDGYPCFNVYEKGKLIGSIQLSVPGVHNVYDALCAVAAARICGVDFETIRNAIERFRGAHRRFERVVSDKDFVIFDDYAHHPTEITATLRAARAICKGRLYCLFQPHTYTRTAALFDDFVTALSLADQAVLLDIYSAREKNDIGIYSSQLAEKIPGAIYAKSFEDAALYVLRNAKKDDIVITMGAGDIYKIADLIK